MSRGEVPRPWSTRGTCRKFCCRTHSTSCVFRPTNGIQKTPYKLWIQQAINASYNVVHAPLTKVAAAQFNATAALQFFSTVEGLDYGA